MVVSAVASVVASAVALAVASAVEEDLEVVSVPRVAWDVAQASEPLADWAQQEPATNNKRIMNLVVGTEFEEMECLEEVEP